MRSRDTGSLIGSEEFRYNTAANRLHFYTSQFDKVKDNCIRQWRDQEYRYDPWGNLIEPPLAQVDQAEGQEQKFYYFHTDQIGTPLELTNSEGEIVWQATYQSWGTIEQLAVNEVEQKLRF